MNLFHPKLRAPLPRNVPGPVNILGIAWMLAPDAQAVPWPSKIADANAWTPWTPWTLVAALTRQIV